MSMATSDDVRSLNDEYRHAYDLRSSIDEYLIESCDDPRCLMTSIETRTI